MSETEKELKAIRELLEKLVSGQQQQNRNTSKAARQPI